MLGFQALRSLNESGGEIHKATAPATIGAAMLEPHYRRQPVCTKFSGCIMKTVDSEDSDNTRLPGATRSGFTTWS